MATPLQIETRPSEGSVWNVSPSSERECSSDAMDQARDALTVGTWVKCCNSLAGEGEEGDEDEEGYGFEGRDDVEKEEEGNKDSGDDRSDGSDEREAAVFSITEDSSRPLSLSLSLSSSLLSSLVSPFTSTSTS